VLVKKKKSIGHPREKIMHALISTIKRYNSYERYLPRTEASGHVARTTSVLLNVVVVYTSTLRDLVAAAVLVLSPLLL
jgi:hypothetical protein